MMSLHDFPMGAPIRQPDTIRRLQLSPSLAVFCSDERLVQSNKQPAMFTWLYKRKKKKKSNSIPRRIVQVATRQRDTKRPHSTMRSRSGRSRRDRVRGRAWKRTILGASCLTVQFKWAPENAHGSRGGLKYTTRDPKAKWLNPVWKC